MSVEVTPSGQIQEFVSVLKRRRWQILLPALFVLLLGTVFAVIVPKKYVIKTGIEMRESNLQAAEDNKRLKESPVDREVSNLENHLRNFSRIERILTKGAESWPEYAQADTPQRHGMVEAVIKNLKVSPKPAKEGSTFIDISYKDVEAQRGEKFLAEVVRVAIDDILNAARLRLQREIESLQKVRDDIYAGANKARTDWTSLASAEDLDPSVAPGFRSRDQRSKYQRLEDRLESKQKALSNLLLEKNEINLRIELFEEDLREMPPSVLVPEPFERTDPAVIAERILEGEQRLAQTESDLSAWRPGTKRHAQISAQRDAILEKLELTRSLLLMPEPVMLTQPNPDFLLAQKSYASEQDKLYLNGQAQLALQEEIADIKASMKGLSVVLNHAETVWEERIAWADQLELAELDLTKKKRELNQAKQFTQDVIVDIATPAYASETAEDPNPYLIMGFCLFGGLAIGLGLALLSEYARNSYRTVSDLASVMSVPVIGSIGPIITRSEARRSMGLKLLVGVPTIIILAGISWMTWTWADEDTRHTLPVEVIQVIDGIRVSLLSM